MKPRAGATLALVFLATCSQDSDPVAEPELASKALGTVPPTEVAIWRKAGASTMPEGRYLQAAAFDEIRRVLVVFGGTSYNRNTGTASANSETWEWSPVTGKWTSRTGAGATPKARSGAAMVFDSLRGKFVLFGGRAGSGANLEDTWEWDPTTGAWTNVSAAGPQPPARAQHGMVYQKSTGKILLFGGGRSEPRSYDGSGIQISLGDTWEYDPTTYAWQALTPASSPAGRHDVGLVWDSARNKAILFGGLRTDIVGAAGVPKQDTWEWDPTTATWTERTAAGTKPSQRYAHAMAFDGARKLAVLFGGWDIGTGAMLNDVWDLEPVSGVWTPRLTGAEAGMPAPRTYATLVSDDAAGRLELVAGAVAGSYGGGGMVGTGGWYSTGGMVGWGGSQSMGGAAGAVAMPVMLPPDMLGGNTSSREIWELNPLVPAFTDRTPPLDAPSARYAQAMAYFPVTGKTYIFGGYDAFTGQQLNELWAWDGKAWAQVPVEVRPSERSEAALAYDPARKSLILFGGSSNQSSNPLADTWEFTSTGKWVPLAPVRSPDPLMGHTMVTDTARNKVLLFGGMSSYLWLDVGPYWDPMRNEVWEWDGLTMTWTNRTPAASVNAPSPRYMAAAAYDQGRQRLFVFDGINWGASPGAFWEWDPISAGWLMRQSADALPYVGCIGVAYDGNRRRMVLLMDPYGNPTGGQQTWEIEGRAPTFFLRTPAGSPGAPTGLAMAFDSLRGVVVLFGGQGSNSTTSETWEYSVTNLGNGEGCLPGGGTTCASGNCVDGVCCDVAACTGACKSCNVAGSEGTCVLAKAGTEVAGSCADGQACDGSGTCKTKNGQPCASAATCASGFCADGVCCDGACTGTCTACNQAGRIGTCTPFVAGTDPQKECGTGTGVCASTCDGVSACAYPGYTVTCANCYTCDGFGTCSNYDYTCGSYGGAGGGFGGAAGGAAGGPGGAGGRMGGAGGNIPNVGGSGGYIPNVGGNGGYIPNVGGSGGNIPNVGGSGGGYIPNVGGSGGDLPNVGGSGGGTGTKPNIGHSGCSCRLDRGETAPGLLAPLVMVGALLLGHRLRRRKGGSGSVS